jgi:Cohesin domain
MRLMKSVCFCCLIVGLAGGAAFGQANFQIGVASVLDNTGVNPATAGIGDSGGTQDANRVLIGDRVILLESFVTTGQVFDISGHAMTWPCRLTSDIGGRPDIDYVPASSDLTLGRGDSLLTLGSTTAVTTPGNCDLGIVCTDNFDCPPNSTCIAPAPTGFCSEAPIQTSSFIFAIPPAPSTEAVAPGTYYVGHTSYSIPAGAAGNYIALPVCVPADGCPENNTEIVNVQGVGATSTPLTISIPLGSCCVGLACTEDQTELECAAAGGAFRPGEACPTNGGPACACDPGLASSFDDGLGCTTDSCPGAGNACSDGSMADATGACHVNNTPAGGCCAEPAGGITFTSAFDGPCTQGICDGGGSDGAAVAQNLPDGPNAACEDGAVCTLDSCDAGACVSEPIVGCVENPELCLDYVTGTSNGAQQCHAPGEIVMIDVNMAFSTVEICGAQIFLQYDTSALELINVVKGSDIPGNAAGAVFNTVLYSFNDTANGTIDLAVGDDPLGNCDNRTSGPATIARLRFNSLTDCKSSDGVCFRPNNPRTFLGGVNGGKIVPVACGDPDSEVTTTCSGPMNVTDAPTINCPFSDLINNTSIVNSDCGSKLATVSFDSVVVSDDCEDGLTGACTVLHYPACEVDADCGAGTCTRSNGRFCSDALPDGSVCNDPALASGGGTFCKGLTMMNCSATDKCSNTTSCDFGVENTGENTLWVELEMSPTMAPGNAFDQIERCVSLEVSQCGDVSNQWTCPSGLPCNPNNGGNPCPGECTFSSAGFNAKTTVTFGQPDNLAGHGQAHVKVPPGNWDCITAVDQWHTLSATCGVECVDNVWMATFKGSPGLTGGSCHWLVNGNLNGDPVIDIIDFVAFLTQNNSAPGEDVICGDLDKPDNQGNGDIHADINADGVVNVQDFAFIVLNFFDNDKAGCDAVCTGGASASSVARGVIAPRDSITIRELVAMGFSTQEALAADINGDGIVNTDDMTAFLNANGGGGSDIRVPASSELQSSTPLRGRESAAGLR